MATIFSDDFETGDLSRWASTFADTGNTVAADATAAHAGSYGLKVVATAASFAMVRGGAPGPAQSQHGITSARFDCKLAGGSVGSAIVRLLALNDANYLGAFAVARIEIDTGGNWSLIYAPRDGSGQVGASFSSNPSLSAWRHIEVIQDRSGTDPTYTVKVDGTTLAGPVTDTTTGLVSRCDGLDLGYNPDASISAVTLYCDNVVVADAAEAVAVQLIRPASDVSAGSWTTDTGGTTSLYATVDETTASDTDYIQSGLGTSNFDEVKLRLQSFTLPTDTTGWELHWRYEKTPGSNSQTVNLRIRLYLSDGTTVVHSETVTAISGTVTQGTVSITSVEAATITSGDAVSGLVVGLLPVAA